MKAISIVLFCVLATVGISWGLPRVRQEVRPAPKFDSANRGGESASSDVEAAEPLLGLIGLLACGGAAGLQLARRRF
jgi:hypothetical protein